MVTRTDEVPPPLACMDSDDRRAGVAMDEPAPPSPPPRACTDSDDDLVCEECGRGDNEAELLICDTCDRGWHMSCANPIVAFIPNGDWHCTACSGRLNAEQIAARLTDKDIFEFLGVDPNPPLEHPASVPALESSKSTGQLLAYTPSEDADVRLRQMRSVAATLMASDAKFCPGLIYSPDMAPKSANRPILHRGGVQVMSDVDAETVKQIHAMGKAGLCPPLIVEQVPPLGYAVVADARIEAGTLLGEYGGEVDYTSKREYESSQVMMTLITAENPAQSLIICSDRFGNIFRFLSGINNHHRKSSKKENTQCIGYDVDGEVRYFLVAIRRIAKGRTLYLNYNGAEDAFPTDHFV